MISLFTFDASEVSCVIFSQKHKSFHHHCDHVLLVLLCIFHFLHQMFGHRHARQICTSTSTTISKHITEHSRTENSSLTFWMPKCLHHFFDLHVFVINYEFIFCRSGPILIRICYDSQNASKRGSESFLWVPAKAVNYITCFYSSIVKYDWVLLENISLNIDENFCY